MQTCLGVTPKTGTAQTNVRKDRETSIWLTFCDAECIGRRSQATNEHWSWDQMNSGGDQHTIESQCVNGDFTSLWNYECSDRCFD
jgi:hypothetical protein